MKKTIFACGLFAALFSAFLIGCDSDDSSLKNAKVQVWLTDAPGDFEAVNIDLRDVEVHVGTDDSESGWKSLAVNDGIYNLLDLTNGLDTLLGVIELPPGEISQIRLKLGDNNSIRVGGNTFPLSTPSAQQSGLKVQVHQTLEAGITYRILLDFDAAKSILLTGNGTYKLKPVIRTITEALDGAIKGVIDPQDSIAAVYAIMDLDTLGTTFSDASGHFLIRGLPAGTYVVAFQPSINFQPFIKEDVHVTLGAVTDLGVVEIVQ